MGKPSSRSKESTSSKSKMSVQMSLQKTHNKKKRSRNKRNANIKKLFNQLRSESISSLSSTNNFSIAIDNTPSPKKRKASPSTSDRKEKQRRLISKDSDASVIIVPDDNTLAIGKIQHNAPLTPRRQSPVHCSTPINKKNLKDPDFIHLISSTSKYSLMNNNTTVQNLNQDIKDLTKEINRDSYLTIDLTTETLNCSNITNISQNQNTVIDLESSVDNADCTVVSVSNTNLSLSGESDITVLNVAQCKSKKDKQMRNFAKGIANLDASEKGRLLELITQNIFTGCSVSNNGRRNPNPVGGSVRETTTSATETPGDTYIKEVILGLAKSRNSIGSNIYNPEKDARNKTGLRMIVIDGSNVAMEHGRGRVFSVKGLKICIDYFLKRGHVVKAFVPRFRCKFGKSSDPRLLDDLERHGLVVYTPSREIQGRMVTSYDDRYIVQCAAEFDGVIVSGDNYRDLLKENPRWRFVIENRLLPFTWVEDMIMFPRDPLGRNGPSLEQFLKHPNCNSDQKF